MLLIHINWSLLISYLYCYQQIYHITSIANLCCVSIYITSDFTSIDIQLNQQHFLLNDEESWFMDEHFTLFQFVLQDIKHGHKVRDCCWYKKKSYKMAILVINSFDGLIEQPLEGAAVYIGKGQNVYSRRVPWLFGSVFKHSYYWSVMNLHISNLKRNPKL